MIIDATQSQKAADVLVQEALHKHEQENWDRRKREDPLPALPLPKIQVILSSDDIDDEMLAQKLLRLGVEAENISYK